MVTALVAVVVPSLAAALWALATLVGRRPRRDPLTGLLDAGRFHAALGAAIDDARTGDRQLTVVVLDLDRRLVKNGLGRSAGDALLQAAGDRLATLAPPGSVAARIHGDEFALVLHPDDPDLALQEVERIRLALAEPFVVSGIAVYATTSVGYARYPADGDDADALLDSADRAMELVKERGGNGVEVDDPGLQVTAVDRLGLEAALRVAVEREDLHLAYQPRIDATTGAVWGAEALLRWEHETMGAIAPTTFIPVAEETGLIEAIGAWVLDTACQQLTTWDEHGLPPMAMSVNVSPRQFDLQPVAEIVRAVLDATGLDPARLELELTESAALRNVDAVTMALTELRELGVGCAIDDFGTGYSSLSTLSRMPFSALKIDRVFTQEIHGERDDTTRASVVLAVLELARALQLTAIAEGVETDHQLRFLREQGCDQIQGHLYLPAVAPDRFEAYVRANSMRPRSWIDLRDRPSAVAGPDPATAC